MHGAVRRFNAAAAADDRREWLGGVSLLVEECSGGSSGAESRVWPGRLLAIGSQREVDAHEAAGRAQTVDLPDSVILPATVNAHTHLDLTHIGPQPHDPAEGFVVWVDMIRTRRHDDAARIAESVRLGVRLSRAAGVAAVGDIAGAPRGRGSLVPAMAMAGAGMPGVSFLEFFGIGRWIWRCADWLPGALADVRMIEGGGVGGGELEGVRIGLQPHAPNTVDRRVYEWSASLARMMGLPLCTHCAETPEEKRFVAEGQGPQREMLERLGVWDDGALEGIGRGLSPVDHVLRALGGLPGAVLVHVNGADEADIGRIAGAGAAVVYCPRASAYFASERHFGPHPYQRMMSAGVRVALGTDSVVNLPAASGRMPGVDEEDGSGRGMSVWDEAQFLWKRDGTDARVLLEMATTAGAAVLGLNPGSFRFGPSGELAGLTAVRLADRAGVGGSEDSAVRSALASGEPMRMLWDRNGCDWTRSAADRKS